MIDSLAVAATNSIFAPSSAGSAGAALDAVVADEAAVGIPPSAPVDVDP
jgi:hypothetical protein